MIVNSKKELSKLATRFLSQRRDFFDGRPVINTSASMSLKVGHSLRGVIGMTEAARNILFFL